MPSFLQPVLAESSTGRVRYTPPELVFVANKAGWSVDDAEDAVVLVELLFASCGIQAKGML